MSLATPIVKVVMLAPICLFGAALGGCGDSDAVATTEHADTSSSDSAADSAATDAGPDASDTTPTDVTADAGDATQADTTVADTAPSDTTPADTNPDDIGADLVDAAEVENEVADAVPGPEHFTVFFASTIDFGTGLYARLGGPGELTHVVGEGDQGKLELDFAGFGVGTYTCGGGSANFVRWTRTNATVQSTSDQGGACTIVVTRYGGIGERVEGTFEGMMGDPTGIGGIPFNNGSFSAHLESDAPENP